jgi:hypothetical protein
MSSAALQAMKAKASVNAPRKMTRVDLFMTELLFATSYARLDEQ